MKRAFILLAAMSMLLVGCQKNTDTPKPGEEPELTLTSTENVTVPEDGGEITITYQLTNPIAEEELSINISTPEWVSLKENNETSIVLTVEPNDGSELRESSVFVSYADVTSFTVYLSQEGGSIKRTATDLTGFYYGEDYEEGVDNFYIHLSDKGFDADGSALADGFFYRLDIYTEVMNYSRENADEIVVPVGTYTLEDSFTAGTFSQEYSSYWVNGPDAIPVIDHTIIDAGTITVTENSIRAELVIAGETHIVTYEGSLVVDDGRQPEFLSTLTEDYIMDLSNHGMDLEGYDDYFGCGAYNYVAFFYPNTEDGAGDYVSLDMVSTGPTLDDTLVGTYTIVDHNPNGPLQATMGFLENGYMTGCWYFSSPDGYDYGDTAPFAQGTFTVTENGEELTFTFDITDDIGNKITGTWTGIPEIYTYDDFSAPKASPARNFVEVTKNQTTKRVK